MSVLLYHPDLGRFHDATSQRSAAVLRRTGWTDAASIADRLPPGSGAGSGKAAWVPWAEQLEIRVTDDDTRATLAAKVEQRLGISDVLDGSDEGETQTTSTAGGDDKEQ